MTFIKRLRGLKKSNTSAATVRPTQQDPPSSPQASEILFSDLQLNQEILRSIKEEGYTSPTPIQAKAVPHIVQGRDLLGCAQTGTGKTAAFALPILHRLAKKKVQSKHIRALVVTPTRELALQVAESFSTYGKYLSLRTMVVFGGVSEVPQKKNLARKPEVLVATPGRLLDLMNQGAVKIDQLEIFVLDEADRMLDMGFVHDVKRIIKALPKVRQNLFFSATMPPDIQKLAIQVLSDPVKVEAAVVSSTSEQVEQFLYYVEKENKRKLLLRILTEEDVTRAIVFTRTKAIANRLTEFLNKEGIKAEAIHGNKSQNARQLALTHFKNGQTRILVASDLAARGIDVEAISHVINFDLPNVPETYVHRIGRTGRASAVGKAISFCETDERPYLKGIEALIKMPIEVVKDHPFASQGKKVSTETRREPRTAARAGVDNRPRRRRRNQR